MLGWKDISTEGKSWFLQHLNEGAEAAWQRVSLQVTNINTISALKLSGKVLMTSTDFWGLEGSQEMQFGGHSYFTGKKAQAPNYGGLLRV